MSGMMTKKHAPVFSFSGRMIAASDEIQTVTRTLSAEDWEGFGSADQAPNSGPQRRTRRTPDPTSEG